MANWIEPVGSYVDAIATVVAALGMELDPRMCLWCDYPMLSADAVKLEQKMRFDIAALERAEGIQLRGSLTYWFVGVPTATVKADPLRHVVFVLNLFYVASGKEFGIWGKLTVKADQFEVPVCLIPKLVASLNKGELEPEGAEVMERAIGHTVYRVVGSDRQWRIPDAFLGFLWGLSDHGIGWEALLDPWSRQLLQTMPTAPPKQTDVPLLPGGKFSEGDFIDTMAHLGMGKSKAKELLKGVPPGASLEEAIRISLK